MKIALCQMDIAWLDSAPNIAKIRHYITEAEAGGADIVVFPEMALSGFCMDAQAASVTLDGPELGEIIGETRGRRPMVMCGAAIRKGSEYNNSVLVVRNGELLDRYSKINLFTISNEDRNYVPGVKLVLLEYSGGTVAPMVCFDLRFSQLFSAAAGKGADVFVVIANWPAAQCNQWRTLLSARAVDAQAFVIGVNRVGRGDGIYYNGDSNVFTPGGKPLLEAAGCECIMFVEIDPGQARSLRKKYPALHRQHQEERSYAVDRVRISPL